MENIIQTIIICGTALAINIILCRVGFKHTQHVVYEQKETHMRETMQTPMPENIPDIERETAYGIAREIQKIFLNDDQIEEDDR